MVNSGFARISIRRETHRKLREIAGDVSMAEFLEDIVSQLAAGRQPAMIKSELPSGPASLFDIAKGIEDIRAELAQLARYHNDAGIDIQDIRSALTEEQQQKIIELRMARSQRDSKWQKRLDSPEFEERMKAHRAAAESGKQLPVFYEGKVLPRATPEQRRLIREQQNQKLDEGSNGR